MAEKKETILELKNVVYSFKTYGGEVKAVRDVSFDVRAGEVLGIVGESGCGKSVTAQCILRLNPEPPGFFEGGEIIYKGEDILKMDKKAIRKIRGGEIGFVFQDPMTSLNPTMKVGKQIMEVFVGREGHNKEEIRQKALEIMKLVGISDTEKRFNQYPHELSGGMKQRIMIAIALVSRPSVLGVIAKICDRVVVMYGGKIVEKGTAREIYYETAHPYTSGLMHSIARLETNRGEKLHPIEGTPPDLFSPPVGCPFAARCDYCMDVCNQLPPEEYKLSDEHMTRCWLQHEMAPDTEFRRTKGEAK